MAVAAVDVLPWLLLRSPRLKAFPEFTEGPDSKHALFGLEFETVLLAWRLARSGGKPGTRSIRSVLRRLGAARLKAVALRHDCRAQPDAQIVGQFVKMGVAVNFDGPLGGVADDVAVVAPLKMIFQLRPGLGVHCVV